MRKLLLLITALLTLGVSGAWAQTGTITYSISTYSSAGSFSSNLVWNSNGTPAMTMTYSGSNGYNTGNGRIFAGNYTLSVSGEYIITGYSITGHCAWNGSNGDVERITPSTGTITDGDGNTVTSLDFAGSDVTLNVSDLNSQSVAFTMAQTAGTGNGAFDATAITITYQQVDPQLAIPQLTTDLSSPKYYSIKSYDRGGYLSSNGSGQAMTHVDFKDGSVWYFTAADGNTSGNAMNGVIAHCFDGTAMTTSWQTSETGGTVYILPNGVNANGLSISKTASISDRSCCDANNTNTGVGNWAPSSNDWRGTTWVIKPTIPSGYYYFKGMDTSRYPYLYSNFVGKSENATYHHSPLSGTNGEIWKVTNNGSSLSIINGEGLPLTIGTTTYETLNIGSVAKGPDFYFTEAINLTNSGNDTKLTTWAGHPDAADNHWTFEAVDVSAGLYNVVIEGNANGYVTYNGQNAKNGGFFVAASIAEGDISVHEIDDYTSSTSIADNTITVVYTHTINYTLTDANGATYTGSYSGIVGEEPVFTGCVGYSLSDITWDGYSFTATINFPFTVSAPTFLGQFHNKRGYNSIDFLWHAESTGVVVHSGDMPDGTSAEQNKYLWTIEPAISGLNITFGIKNVATDTYITSTETGNSHGSGAVTLTDTATPLQYQTSSTTNCGEIYVWYIPSTGKYLSANSVYDGAGSFLGVWSLASTHDGPSTGFHTYLDLISRYWEKNAVSSKLANAGQYGYPANDNEYTVALNGVQTALNGGSYTGNATNYNNLRTWYAGFLAAAPVVPTSGFLRIKSSALQVSTQPYLIGENHATQTARAAFSASPTGNKDIWYFDGTNLYNYGNGGYPAVNNSTFLGVATTAGATAATVAFEDNGTSEFGALSIKLFGNTRYLFTNTGLYTDAGGAKNLNGYSFNVEDVTSLPVTITAAGYATLFAPVALSIPSGVTAYVAADEGEYLTLKAIEGGVIHENTGVILKGEAGSYNFAITTGGSVESNALTGQVAAQVRPAGSYILATGSEGVGFYANGATTIPGFKAYLPSGVGEVKSFRFGDVDAIRNISNELKGGEIYDLSGRRVKSPSNGLYIVNGKKVVIK